MLVLDVRTPAEYATSHLPHAVHVPTPMPPLHCGTVASLCSALDEATEGVSKRTPIFVYCKKGIRSALASAMLQSQGYQQVTNLGGIQEEPLSAIFRRNMPLCPRRGRE